MHFHFSFIAVKPPVNIFSGYPSISVLNIGGISSNIQLDERMTGFHIYPVFVKASQIGQNSQGCTDWNF